MSKQYHIFFNVVRNDDYASIKSKRLLQPKQLSFCQIQFKTVNLLSSSEDCARKASLTKICDTMQDTIYKVPSGKSVEIHLVHMSQFGWTISPQVFRVTIIFLML